ncbi:unnamed protein product [Pylaiella littoralis]
MMGGRGPIPCRFGVDCHRMDCWYSHPAGRTIDAAGGGGGANGSSSAVMPSTNTGRGAFGAAAGGSGGCSGGGGGGARSGMVPGGGMMPQASPRMGGGGGGGGNNECRFAFECKRRDCHFNHPFGRAIDGDGAGGGGGSIGGRPALNRGPSSNNSMGSVTRGMSELSFGSYPPANATDDDQDLKDTWFPKARDCACCKGYVYGCTSNICESMGQCTCSIEEKDLDGSSDISSNISRTNSPQVEMGTNGGSLVGAGGGGGPRPPQPPTEAALAGARAGAGGSGGGRPSPGMGGGGPAECRYGTGCKRGNCSFKHPQGRSMDADGVTFGDFGGGGSRSAGGTTTAEQDLMDTWYPDCRECACCKGYKHGCNTPACKTTGLCACSSGDGPAAPISAVSALPTASPSPPEAAATPPTAGNEGAGAGASGISAHTTA